MCKLSIYPPWSSPSSIRWSAALSSMRTPTVCPGDKAFRLGRDPIRSEDEATPTFTPSWKRWEWRKIHEPRFKPIEVRGRANRSGLRKKREVETGSERQKILSSQFYSICIRREKTEKDMRWKQDGSDRKTFHRNSIPFVSEREKRLRKIWGGNKIGVTENPLIALLFHSYWNRKGWERNEVETGWEWQKIL